MLDHGTGAAAAADHADVGRAAPDRAAQREFVDLVAARDHHRERAPVDREGVEHLVDLAGDHLAGHREALAVRELLAVVDDRDLEAERRADGGEREADVPAADDQQAAGRLEDLEHDAAVAGTRPRAARDEVAGRAHVDRLRLDARAGGERRATRRGYRVIDCGWTEGAERRAAGAHEQLRPEPQAALLAGVDHGRDRNGGATGESDLDLRDELRPHVLVFCCL